MLLLSGCTGAQQSALRPSDGKPPDTQRLTDANLEKVESLKNDLASLNRDADPVEARRVAETAIGYSIYLAEKYEVVRPAVLHNVLIRLGLKKRGLCYHWTEDLMQRLQSLNLKTFRLRWGVAHRGSELREHNSVVITARHQVFEQGIVLDPWRNSGDLYWARIEADRYPWRELPPEQW
jgi:hypothetical protein